MTETECQHELKSLPLTDLYKLHYWCTKCEEFLHVEVNAAMEILGKSFEVMHTQFAHDLGGTYVGATTYDQVSK